MPIRIDLGVVALIEDSEPVVTAVLLARGLCEIYDRIAQEGEIVHQGASMPPIARRALARLSRHCLTEGVDDLGSSIHLVMGAASRAMGFWGIPSFAGDFKYSDVELVDDASGVPTADCRELARLGGSEIDAIEDIHHEQLRVAVQSYPAAQRNRAYTSIREFVVRQPVCSLDALHRFITNGHLHGARAIASLYRPIPQTAMANGSARLCGRCGSLLWPTSDPAFPNGRCRVRRCAIRGETIVGYGIADPSLFRLATGAVLAFWVGPGLDEVALHDHLAGQGRSVSLYPMSDAADVGLDGLEVGLDVKNYASPLVLGARLSRGVGRLTIFGRKIIVVPDYKVRLNPRYIDDLRASYVGAEDLEFMTVASVIAEFSA
ncbi:hypothetical protein X736_30225 [Mesorhizobium sp. L2C089B000]|nr:hypothetical protein X736_30225 [Mesorhizobium sp. L2C089B000]ESZ51672.1 hypothetical protein X731_03465 [Mesorhizobium sp. L2C054A000]